MIFALGLGWLWLHLRLTRMLRSDRLADGGRRAAAAPGPRVAAFRTGLAAACVLFTATTGMQPSPPGVRWLASELADDQWVVPWSCSQRLPRRRTRGGSTGSSTLTCRDAPPLWQTLLPAALVAGTVLLGGFWLLEEYASAVGGAAPRRWRATSMGWPRPWS